MCYQEQPEFFVLAMCFFWREGGIIAGRRGGDFGGHLKKLERGGKMVIWVEEEGMRLKLGMVFVDGISYTEGYL